MLLQFDGRNVRQDSERDCAMKLVRVAFGLFAVAAVISAFIINHKSPGALALAPIILFNLLVIGTASGHAQQLLERPHNKPLHGWFLWFVASVIVCVDISMVLRVIIDR